MRLIILLAVCIHQSLFCYGQASESKRDSNSVLKFLEKSEYIFLGPNNYGQHIRIKHPIMGNTLDSWNLDDDRGIFAWLKLTKTMKAELLAEFLSFQADTAKSNKYYFMKVPRPNSDSYSTRWNIPKDKSFTVEIEPFIRSHGS